MPELPEVENLVIELRGVLEKSRISNVEIHNESILETPREWIETQICGKKIIQLGRRGKFIQIYLSGRYTLWFHLGMTGQLLLEDPSEPLKPHTHFVLTFEDSTRRLIYRDVRRFGRIALMPYEGREIPKGVGQLGFEPNQWGREDFISLFKGRHGRIKSLLLNQHLVSGLGNIYADESLHRSGIHPLRRAYRVTRQRLSRLHESACEVLEEAIRWGGSSIDNYVHLDGLKGKFQEFHRVYGRQGEGCKTCNTPIRRVKFSGRSSFFCPKCQQ